jgi:hypothetical protein
MIPEYSKLIVHGIVLLDAGTSETQARFDFTTMTIRSGIERRAHEFKMLLESSGFKIIGIWIWSDKDGVVEA